MRAGSLCRLCRIQAGQTRITFLYSWLRGKLLISAARSAKTVCGRIPQSATDSCRMRLQFVNNSSTHSSCCPHRCRKCCCQLLCATVRYPVDYPHQPLVLKVTSTKGLIASDTRSLTKLLNSASAEHARDKVVAGFSIADACQEFLLSKNNPEAAKIDRTVQEAVPGNLF